MFLGEIPQIFRPYPTIAARFRSCGKVSRRSAEGPRRLPKEKNITGKT